jgi:hypothetical protein
LIYLPTSARLCSNSSGAASILRAKSPARILSLAADALTDEQIVASLKIASATVERTRKRFDRDREPYIAPGFPVDVMATLNTQQCPAVTLKYFGEFFAGH